MMDKGIVEGLLCFDSGNMVVDDVTWTSNVEFSTIMDQLNGKQSGNGSGKGPGELRPSCSLESSKVYINTYSSPGSSLP